MKDNLSVEIKFKKITLDIGTGEMILYLKVNGFIGKKEVYSQNQKIKVRKGNQNKYNFLKEK